MVQRDVIENGLGWAASEAVHATPSARKVLDRIAPYAIADETTVRPAEDAYATLRLVTHQEVEYALPIDAAVPALRAVEAAWRESRAVRDEFDPRRRFVNPYLNRLLG